MQTRSEITLNKKLRELELAHEAKIKKMRKALDARRARMIAAWEKRNQ